MKSESHRPGLRAMGDIYIRIEGITNLLETKRLILQSVLLELLNDVQQVPNKQRSKVKSETTARAFRAKLAIYSYIEGITNLLEIKPPIVQSVLCWSFSMMYNKCQTSNARR